MTRLRSLKKLKSEVGTLDLFSSTPVTCMLSAASAAARPSYNELKFPLEFVLQESRSLPLARESVGLIYRKARWKNGRY